MNKKKTLSLLLAAIGAVVGCVSLIGGQLDTVELVSSIVLVVAGLVLFFSS